MSEHEHLVDTDEGTAERGLTRRTMIKRAAAAGAVAWTAPVIIDSLASPAAAATVPSGCYHILFTATSNSCLSASVASNGCSGVGTTCASPSPTIPADLLSCFSVSPADCGTSTTNASDPITFTIGSACACTIIGARGRRTSAIGAQCDVSETINSGSKSATFDGTGILPGLADWASFELWVTCT